MDGKCYYYYIVPENYKDGTITINVTYNGQEYKMASKNGTEKVIFGRNLIILNITDTPDFVRVGYSATYRGKIFITGESIEYRELFFVAWYDDNIPFITQQIFTNELGEFEHTISEISDGYENLTIWFEHKKTTTIAYNYTTQMDSILPKWNVNFTYESLPDIIRFGQELNFNLKFNCTLNSSLSFNGLPVTFTFRYGIIVEIYTEFVGENNIVLFIYTVAESFSGDLNVSIEFSGTTKFSNFNENFLLEITEKIQVNLEFVEKPRLQYMTGTHYYSVKAIDEDGNPLENIKIVFEVLDINSEVIYTATTTTDENGIASISLELTKTGDQFTIRVRFIEKGIYAGSEITFEDIRVVDSVILLFDLLPYILIGIGIAIGLSVAIHRGIIIPKRTKEMEYLQEMYQKLSDVENIQYLIILNKRSGVPCFNKGLTEVPIDGALVSGFLTAISSFGAEIGDKMEDKKESEDKLPISYLPWTSKPSSDQSGLQELSYGRFKIILEEGNYVKNALLLFKRPSDTLRNQLKIFTRIFEAKYEKKLKEDTGEMLKEGPLMQLIEEVFEADLLYPHHVVGSKIDDYFSSVSKKDVGKKIINIAKSEEFNLNFYLRDMISYLKTHGIDEVKSFEKLDKLKKEKIIFAINPRTNYLIEKVEPYIAQLDSDDRNVLFAVFKGHFAALSIQKYFKKRNIVVKKDIDVTLQKLKELKLIVSGRGMTEVGNVLATLLKLIPDL